MRLTDLEREVLGHIELDFRTPLTEVAKKLGQRDHVVRHAVKKLTDKGLLRKRIYTDPYKLGFSVYSVLLACKELTSQKHAEVAAALRGHHSVVTVMELGGAADFEITLFVRDIPELVEFFNWLSSDLSEFLAGKWMTVQASQTIFGFKFDCQHQRAVNEVSFGVDRTEEFSADENDIAIIEAAREDVSPKAIAKSLGLPFTTVDYRLKRLEKAGVIRGHIYEMTGNELGLSSYIIRVFSRGLSEELRRELLEFCRAHRSVTYMNINVGHWDYTVGVSVESQRDLRNIERDIAAQFGSQIAKLETQERYGTLKVEDYPGVAPREEDELLTANF